MTKGKQGREKRKEEKRGKRIESLIRCYGSLVICHWEWPLQK
jgi:hypothetical protein